MWPATEPTTDLLIDSDRVSSRAPKTTKQNVPSSTSPPISRLILLASTLRSATCTNIVIRLITTRAPRAWGQSGWAGSASGVVRPVIFPSANSTTAFACDITFWSCVEKMKVVPFCTFNAFIKSMIAWPVTESRFAVGSSANTICGSVTSARATATR